MVNSVVIKFDIFVPGLSSKPRYSKSKTWICGPRNPKWSRTYIYNIYIYISIHTEFARFVAGMHIQVVVASRSPNISPLAIDLKPSFEEKPFAGYLSENPSIV
jgi:hypothetical protein